MTYLLERFGSLTLPTAKPNSTLDTGSIQSGLMDIPGGAYDSWGSNQASMGAHRITHTALLTGNGLASIESTFNSWRAQIGKRDRLYRRHPSGALQWVYARLSDVKANRQAGQINTFEISLTFEIAYSVWNGYKRGWSWALDDGSYFDTGLVFDSTYTYTIPQSGTIVLTSTGNYPVTNPLITIYAGGTSVTNLAMADSVAGFQMLYNGTIQAGGTLVIDGGAYTCYNGTADHYAYMARGSLHVINEWFKFLPGGTITITKTEAGTVTTGVFSFSDGWA